jgi:hypothetical protein
MILRILGYILVAFLCMGAIGLGLDFLRLFGVHSQDNVSGVLLLPMAGVAWIATHGKSDPVAVVPEMIKVFAFFAALLVAMNVGSGILLLAVFAVYVAVYGKPFLLGWNYLFVRRPLEQQALKQQTLSAKLDADGELAEATIRHERARAALAEAERAVEEAERTGNARRR